MVDAASGVYAYVAIRGEPDYKAKVKSFYSVFRGSGAYYFRYVRDGRQYKVVTANVKGIVSFSVAGSSSLPALTAKRDELMAFRRKYATNNRDIAFEISKLNRRISSLKDSNIEVLVLKNGKKYKNVKILKKEIDGAKVQVDIRSLRSPLSNSQMIYAENLESLMRSKLKVIGRRRS